jgi:arylsulfate sulfotransferase
MKQKLCSSSNRLLVLCAFCGLVLQFPGPASAVTILSGPTFTKSTNAPLAGTLRLSTDVPSRVSVFINDGGESWGRDFHTYGTNLAVPLYGFKAARSNAISVVVRDMAGNVGPNVPPAIFISDPLPADFPVINVLTNDPARMEPGYTLFRVVNNNTSRAYITIVNNDGEVVWYSSTVPTTLDVRQLADGNLFIPLSTNFIEVTLLGDTVRSWATPTNRTINFHDGVPTDHGTILYIDDDGRVITNYPTSSTNPTAPHQNANVMFNRIVEISGTNGTKVNDWPLIDMLDPMRIDYLTFTLRSTLGWDSEHANAVIEDPRDNSIIVSMRHQDAVIKFTRSGQLKWILGPHENWGAAFQPYLLTPVGTPFAWNYAQHAPMITPQGTLLVYDDGNFRASPFDSNTTDQNNYTRAVEYDINEDTMEVRQVWEYGSNITKQLYTSRVGNADWLTNSGNVLVTFGNVDWDNHAKPSAFSSSAAELRIQEVTHDPVPNVVFDLSVFDYNNTSSTFRGYFAYRSHRIPDLYSHLPQPVTDLTIDYSAAIPHLRFSGDSTRSYAVEASDDLVTWTEIGSPTMGTGESYDFIDASANSSDTRFYRIVSH